MESVIYEHHITQRSVRLQRLKIAMSAFLCEPYTARDVRSVALFVNIPTPSRVEAAIPGKRILLRGQGPRGGGGKARKTKTGSSDTAPPMGSVNTTTTTAPNQAASASPAVPSTGATKEKSAPTRYTKLRAKLFLRKHKREAAVEHCTLAAYKRLHQATRDAAALSRWLRSPPVTDEVPAALSSSSRASSPEPAHLVDDNTVPRCYARNVTVTVAAVLSPRTMADLALFTAWQSPSLDAHHCSPLREADFLVVNLGGGSERVEVVRTNLNDAAGGGKGKKKKKSSPSGRTPMGGFVNRKVRVYTSFFVDWELHGCPRVDMNRLLMSHQSLFLDITWCVHAGIAKYKPKTAGQGQGHQQQRRKRLRAEQADEEVSKAVLDLHTFLDAFQGKMKLPKESRVACWLSYHGEDSVVINAVGDEDEDDAYSAGPLLFSYFTGISGIAPHTMACLSAEEAREMNEQAGTNSGGPAARRKAQQARTRKNFAHLHTQLALLYKRLFGGGASSGSAMGQNVDWTLLTGFGGAVAHIVAAHQHVALPAREVLLAPNKHGQLRKIVTAASLEKSSPGSGSVGDARKAAATITSVASSAALLVTRAQRDLYALLSFLIGQERLDLYSRAVSFLRTQQSRLALAAHFKSRFVLQKPLLVLGSEPSQHGEGRRRNAGAEAHAARAKTSPTSSSSSALKAVKRKGTLSAKPKVVARTEEGTEVKKRNTKRTATSGQEAHPASVPQATKQFLKELLGSTAKARRRLARNRGRNQRLTRAVPRAQRATKAKSKTKKTQEKLNNDKRQEISTSKRPLPTGAARGKEPARKAPRKEGGKEPAVASASRAAAPVLLEEVHDDDGLGWTVDV